YIKESDVHFDGAMLANLEQYPVVGPVARLAREQLSISGADIQQWLTNSAQTVLHNVASLSGGFVLSALGTLVAYFFMLFLLYFAATGRWGMAVFMLVWGIVVSTSDNILRPMLVSRYAPVSAFTVFVGVVGGIAAFGTIGIVIGPVFLALVAAILDYFDEKVIAPNVMQIEAQADESPTKPGL